MLTMWTMFGWFLIWAGGLILIAVVMGTVLALQQRIADLEAEVQQLQLEFTTIKDNGRRRRRFELGLDAERPVLHLVEQTGP